MSRRIEVELTSTREDGTWTWRAAGAKQPKGELAGSHLYEGAAIGDICRVEADFLLDGIDILQVFPPKAKKERTDLLEMKPRAVRDDELVTQTKAPRTERSSRDGKKRRDGGRRDRDERSGKGSGRGRGENRGPRRPEPEQRPKPKRLRPRRVHRSAVLAEVPEELAPIAEQVQKGGIPAVRAAIEKQNSEAKEAGTPEIAVAPVLAIAEDLLPKLRAAEWRDRADAALADLDELDLRDLRSVVVASDSARDDESKAIAEQLSAGLNTRIESDHQQWLADIQEAVDGGRSVRALRLSSRPVKAGAPLPPELATKLTIPYVYPQAADAGQDRWATVIDAVAFSPIRNAVVPAGYPEEPTKELLDAVRRVADRVPAIAAHFGIEPGEAAKARRRRPAKKTSKPKPGKADATKPKPGKADATKAKADTAAEPAAPETPAEPKAETAAPEIPAETAPETPAEPKAETAE